MTQIFAHRGFSSCYPENTLPAFAAAIQFADGIELDVQLSKDQQLVVIHDETIDRTTDGTGYVQNLTLAELQSYNAGAKFKRITLATKIPSLREVLELLIRENFTGVLNIELKNDKIHYEDIERKLLAVLSEYALPFPLIFSSFYLPSLRKLAMLYPQGNFAYIYRNETTKAMVTEKTIFLSAMHPKITWLRKHVDLLGGSFQQRNWLAQLPRKFRRYQALDFHKEMRVWTVNTEADMRLCFENQIAGIFTDYPDLARKVQAEVHEKSIGNRGSYSSR